MKIYGIYGICYSKIKVFPSVSNDYSYLKRLRPHTLLWRFYFDLCASIYYPIHLRVFRGCWTDIGVAMFAILCNLDGNVSAPRTTQGHVFSVTASTLIGSQCAGLKEAANFINI